MDTDDIDVARLVRLRGSVWAAIERIAGKRGGAGFVRAAVKLHLERCITDCEMVDIKGDDIKGVDRAAVRAAIARAAEPVVYEGPKALTIRELIARGLTTGSGEDMRLEPVSMPPIHLNPAEELMEALRAKPMTAREAAAVLGWPEGKVRKAELALSKDGLIWYQGGVMTAME